MRKAHLRAVTLFTWLTPSLGFRGVWGTLLANQGSVWHCILHTGGHSCMTHIWGADCTTEKIAKPGCQVQEMNILSCGPVFTPKVQYTRWDFSSIEQAKVGKSDAFVSGDSRQYVKPFKREFSDTTALYRPKTRQRAGVCNTTNLQDGVILQAHTAPKPLCTRVTLVRHFSSFPVLFWQAAHLGHHALLALWKAACLKRASPGEPVKTAEQSPQTFWMSAWFTSILGGSWGLWKQLSLLWLALDPAPQSPIYILLGPEMHL